MLLGVRLDVVVMVIGLVADGSLRPRAVVMVVVFIIMDGDDGERKADGGEGATGDEEGLEAESTDVGDESEWGNQFHWGCGVRIVVLER